jgi:hypothetical protein
MGLLSLMWEVEERFIPLVPIALISNRHILFNFDQSDPDF